MGIPLEQRLIAVLFSLVLVLVTIQLIRKNRLREEYALIWLGASLVIFLLSLFGELVASLASILSISYSPTLVLVAGLLFALVLLLSQSVVISSQADQLRDLAQNLAIMEWRLRNVETARSQEQTRSSDSALNPSDTRQLLATAINPVSEATPKEVGV